jgi:tetratricopeptide (TPR) repeat protein
MVDRTEMAALGSPEFSSAAHSGPGIKMRICAALSLIVSAACLHAQTGGCEVLPAAKPEDINALANTGLALSRAKQYDAAAVCYRKVLAIDPNIPQIQLNLGLAEFKSGRFRQAPGRSGPCWSSTRRICRRGPCWA